MKTQRTSEKYAQMMEDQGFSAHTWSNGPNFAYPVHDHPYDKLIVVLEGSIRFDLPRQGTPQLLKEGDQLPIPAGTAHSAIVGPQGVTCLEGQKLNRSKENHQ